MKHIQNKTILVTGGTGTFGQAFVEALLKFGKPKKIIIFSRDEYKQFKMSEKLKSSALRFFLGDIRDFSRLQLAFQGVNYVVHAAALKQVISSEYNPIETINTNIFGAQNIIRAALENKVNKVLALSTDKACSPINLYGATKLVSDKLFIAANNYVGKSNIAMSIVRYGNVVDSRGSVVEIFKNQLNKYGKIFLTHEQMTRFWITKKKAIDFVLDCLNVMEGGEIFIPKIKSVKIIELARIMSKNNFITSGIRPGEKLHEKMFSQEDSQFQDIFEDVNKYIILSSIIKKKSKFRKLKKTKIKEYVSNNNENFTKQEIKKIIFK